MDLDLEGRAALVTGAHRGTGAGIAKGLAAEGARVVVHGFAAGEADAVAEEIGDEAIPIAGDILTDEGAAAAAEAALAAAGRIDILVNNYGKAERGTWTESGSADWIDLYEKNVLSAARMVRLLVPAMKQAGWGRVVNLGTVGSSRPGARMPAYYAAKGALATMTVSLAKDLAGTGITVNTVSPGLIRTVEVEETYRKLAARKGWGETWAEIEAGIMREVMENPTGRIARIEEVADLVAFLVSPRAGFINGQNIRIDGGAVDIVQ
ncbi:MAG: SDR family oxidoreductase [Minwuiales bacterium]|nr:SDR family oxidoreductase [Minwuiales bacterium]